MNKKKTIAASLVIIFLISIIISYFDPQTRHFVTKTLGIKKAPESTPTIAITEYKTGINAPTMMTFVNNDILYFEKYTGKIRLIKDGELQDEPILDLNVNGAYEGGGLGILSVNSTVFVYFTEAVKDGGEVVGDNVYKYKWKNYMLEDPTLVNHFVVYDSSHHGGAMTVDERGSVYLIRGDQSPEGYKQQGPLQNEFDGPVDDTGVIIILGLNSTQPTPSLTLNPFNHYQAIGIRNSFGITIDPITGYMWDTENGPEDNDEINLVLPKFNSGWSKIMGPANNTQIKSLPQIENFVYSDPEFTWQEPVAPTAIAFPGDRWGEEYKDSVFVSSCSGKIYKFSLNSTRTGFTFNDENLKDLVLNRDDSDDAISFLSDVGCATDIKFGPDNAMYVISFANNGVIYRITPP